MVLILLKNLLSVELKSLRTFLFLVKKENYVNLEKLKFLLET